jgi:hypothetical protein
VDKKKTKQILQRADDTLKTAEFGLKDLKGSHDERKIAGLRNLIVFGRAVTNVLQNLRSCEPTFDDWYNEYRREMESDQLMKYFYKIRSEVLKEGVLNVSTSVHIKSLGPSDIFKFGTPPLNAKAMFIGDQYGNSGWEVEMPDGNVEKYYFTLPQEVGFSCLIFSNLNEGFENVNLKDISIEKLSEKYINYLTNMVNCAKLKFENE